MRILTTNVAIAILLISCNGTQQSDTIATPENIFATIEHDKVIAYDYNGAGDIEIIDKQGNLAKEINKQVELTEDQAMRLTNSLCDKSTYGEDIAMCFNPRFGIVYYNTDKPVAFVSICLECNYLISSINIPYADGFSSKGIKQIVDFEKELDFTITSHR